MFKKQVLLSKLLLCGFFSVISTPARAQITPDNTLRTETSKLTPNVLINGANTDLINGGAIRGNNLFHSFTEFNIKDGQRVYFANPSGVVNILTRVTGNNASNIFGTLGVDGAANLFLINPNGVLFGKNASLDVRGSFVGTTANGVQFGNQGNFSATNPEVPALLTINPSALFFNQINPNAAIVNNSVAPAGKDLSGSDTIGLRVPNGKSLLLVGGNVIMDGGLLNAYGGRVELGGLATAGTVGINNDGSLSFADNLAKGDVSLTNGSGVNVSARGGGSIGINARNLEISRGSSLNAGILNGQGIKGASSGNIAINVSDKLTITDSSKISNSVGSSSFGNAGDVVINTDSLNVTNGAQIVGSTYGNGSAGNIFINARGISLDGTSQNEIFTTSGIHSTVGFGAKGNSGNINISADCLNITNGADVSAKTFSNGSAGNVFINARSISLDGTSQDGIFTSGIHSTVSLGAKGNSGNVNILTDSLNITNGADVSASTFSNGSAGNMFINARSISLDGTGQDGIFTSGIYSNVNYGGKVNGGDINISTDSLNITKGANVGASTYGNGSAGNVFINASSGISLDGTGQKENSSGIYSKVNEGAKGNGGNINISTGFLNVTNGTQLSASTSGQGNAGDVTVNAKNTISLAGNSNIVTGVAPVGIGNGGNININGATLSLSDGALIDTSTFGQGNAGNIQINGSDSISLNSGSNLQALAVGIGNAGKIIIDSPVANVSLQGSGTGIITGVTGQINVAGFEFLGDGQGGDISINARNLDVKEGARISTFTNRKAGVNGLANAGNIKVNVLDSLYLTGGAQLSTSTSGQGNAGDVTVNAKNALTLAGHRTAILSTVETGSVGKGGNIDINGATLSLSDGAGLSASTSGIGNAGNVTVNAKNALTLTARIYGAKIRQKVLIPTNTS